MGANRPFATVSFGVPEAGFSLDIRQVPWLNRSLFPKELK
jgi:hypothetical protein